MITNVQWDNDPILGNLSLSFIKDEGVPYKTIVLAGENGTGKTRILQTISTFLNLGTIEPFRSITYDVNGVKYTITPRDVNASVGFHIRTKEGEDGYLYRVHFAQEYQRAAKEANQGHLPDFDSGIAGRRR